MSFENYNGRGKIIKKPYLKFKNIYVIPVFHSRIEFSKLIRTAFYQIYPDVIAVELPNNIKEQILEGVERLPYLSLIGYADTMQPKTMSFIPIDPGDAIIEGIRLSKEHKITLEFIDLSVKDYTPFAYQLPDDYALSKLGLEVFYREVFKIIKEKKKQFPEDDKLRKIDEKREKFMASHLIKLMKLYNRVLFICGLAHWENIKHYLENESELKEVEEDLLPQRYVEIFNIKGGSARFLLREIPYITINWEKFREKYSEKELEKYEVPEVFFQKLNSFDKQEFIRPIFLQARDFYREEFKEFIDLHRLKTLFQYCRNLSIAENLLNPTLFQLLVSSKNCVDDDYAWKVLEVAAKYPFEDDSGKYPDLDLNMEGAISKGKFIKLRPRHARYFKENDDLPMKKRPKEKYPGEWRDLWNGGKDLVSWPPEDIVIEDYFAFIRKRIKKKLKDQNVKVEEFKSSLMDGIDIKETIRKWPIERKIYVRNERPIVGKIDTLIVIFDDEAKEENEKYPFKLTWWAEHDKESDMALYTTNPGEYVIGPGIAHVEVGGLLTIFPPGRLRPVFLEEYDFEYGNVENKAERLLKAGIIYSSEKYIIYIAKDHPRPYFFNLAARKNRELIFYSIDNFSTESLRCVKHVHFLRGRYLRKIAHNYIFL